VNFTNAQQAYKENSGVGELKYLKFF